MRKRSKYRPRQVFADPVAWVINGFKPMSSHSEAIGLKIKNHQALFDVTQGDGDRTQVDVLIAAMNMAEALYQVNQDLGKQYAAEVKAAQDAIYTMAKRGVAKGRFLFTGPELQAINTGMEVHDAQLDACTVAELESAIKFVYEAIKHRRARPIVEVAA
jgi:uncharacterized caspase-like protein